MHRFTMAFSNVCCFFCCTSSNNSANWPCNYITNNRTPYH